MAARRVPRGEGMEEVPMSARRVGRGEESIADTVRELISDIRDLVRAELQLARQEIRADLNALLMATALLVVGGVAAFLGVTFLLLAVVFALGAIMPLGLASFIVGAVVLIIGGILAWRGLDTLKSTNPLPEQTIESAREDAEWMQNRMR